LNILSKAGRSRGFAPPHQLYTEGLEVHLGAFCYFRGDCAYSGRQPTILTSGW
jgi:hypothetical protein